MILASVSINKCLLSSPIDQKIQYPGKEHKDKKLKFAEVFYGHQNRH